MLCVGEADQEAGAPSGVQGVQGEGSETLKRCKTLEIGEKKNKDAQQY